MNITHISSLNNPVIKNTVRLATDKTYRQEIQEFIAQGNRVISTLLSYQISIRRLFCTQETLSEAQAMTTDAQLFCVTPLVMSAISTLTTPPNLLAVCAIPEQTISFTTPGIIVHHLSDPGNMGTIIRTAVAAGMKSIIIAHGVDPWSIKVVQASAGTVGAPQLHRVSWDTIVQQIPTEQLAPLVVQNGSPLDPTALQNKFIIVGNEAHGLPESVIAQCGTRYTLPMHNTVESLNAAVAGSIALYLVGQTTSIAWK